VKKRGRKKGFWKPVKDVLTPNCRLSRNLSKLMILENVWKKETGAMFKYWELAGVKLGTIFVKTNSSAAAQELKMRSAVLAKDLNKYFQRPWIREIKKI
jgi:Dna[CI] antecedent, DciA